MPPGASRFQVPMLSRLTVPPLRRSSRRALPLAAFGMWNSLRCEWPPKSGSASIDQDLLVRARSDPGTTSRPRSRWRRRRRSRSRTSRACRSPRAWMPGPPLVEWTCAASEGGGPSILIVRRITCGGLAGERVAEARRVVARRQRRRSPAVRPSPPRRSAPGRPPRPRAPPALTAAPSRKSRRVMPSLLSRRSRSSRYRGLLTLSSSLLSLPPVSLICRSSDYRTSRKGPLEIDYLDEGSHAASPRVLQGLLRSASGPPPPKLMLIASLPWSAAA